MRRRRHAELRTVTREETKTFEVEVSTLLAHYLVTSPRRMPTDERIRNELLNFIHNLRSQLQHVGVFAESPKENYSGS